MTFDGIIINKIFHLLKSFLPFYIQKINRLSKTDILLQVKSKQAKFNLIISCHPNYNRIYITNRSYETIEADNFVLNLRRHLLNAKVEDIKNVDFDRFLIFKLRNTNELFDQVYYNLHIELMAKYANIILCNDEDIIIDALKKVAPYENINRIVQINHKLNPIQKQDKFNPFTLEKFEIEYLDNKLCGFSPLLYKEFRYRLSQGESYYNIINDLHEANSVYFYPSCQEFHLIELKHLKEKPIQLDIELAFDYIYYDLCEKERIRNLHKDVFNFFKREIKRLKQKKTKLNEEILTSETADRYKLYGDLIFTNSNLNARLNKIHLNDYDGNEYLIDLDSRYNLKENANLFYKKYKKLKTARKYLESQIELTDEKLDYLEAIHEDLAFADLKDIEDIRNDLIEKKFIRATNNKKNKQKKNKINIHQITYKDAQIYYGTNAIQNDYLSFKFAKKDDYWFHVKDMSSAHVILRADELNEDLIRYCSRIAIYFSKARYSSSVAVNYTQIKYISKIKGSKLAFVKLHKYKTIFIDPFYDNDFLALN